MLTNASDGNGDTLTASGLAISTGGGSLVDNLDGTWTYTPAGDDDAFVSFSYTIGDGALATGASADLDITPVNDAPTTTPVTLAAIAEDSDARLITQSELLANASDIDGDNLTATGLAISAGGGLLVDNGNGSWSYTPAANDGSSVSFSYTVTDGAFSASGSATLDITPVNDPPANLELSWTEVVENIPGATVGLLSASDQDAGDATTYTIRPGFDASLFTIVGSELRVGSAGLDYEAPATRTVIVRATDSGGAFVEETFVIDVLDRAEVVLTSGTDTVAASADSTQFIGNSATLNPTDNLDGGLGDDSLLLYGSGTFDLNSLAGYVGIEEVSLINFTGSSSVLTLRAGTSSSVAVSGTASSSIVLPNAAIATTIQNDGTAQMSVTLNGNSTATTIEAGNGSTSIALNNSSTVTTINGGNGTVSLSGTASVGSIQGGNGGYTINLNGTGTVSSFQGGSGSDTVRISNVAGWNPNMVFDGGAGSDEWQISVAGTFNLQPTTLSSVERLFFVTSGANVLVDNDALTDVLSITGGTNKLITGDSVLNLSGKTVTGGNTIYSTNATGTAFAVSSNATAFQIFGGPGSDTIQTTSFAFTSDQRDAIFNGPASIEIIRDTSGFYGDETDNTITGTGSVDNMQGGGGADRLIGAAGADFLGGARAPTHSCSTLRQMAWT